jgi:hypothetical protein
VLFDLFVFDGLFIFIFAILGINFFKGSFSYCYLGDDVDPREFVIGPTKLGIEACINER